MQDYEETIRKEEEALELIPLIVKDHGHLLKYIWKYGNGEGGDLFRQIKDQMVLQGFICETKTIIKRYEKKRIHHMIREDVLVRDGYKCVSCNSNRSLTVDHIYPEVLGGTLDLSNLQTLCKSCNSKKGSKVI